MITKVCSLATTARGRLIMLAHEDRGSISAEWAVLAAVFIGIAIVVGKVFGHAIELEANKVASQITSQ